MQSISVFLDITKVAHFRLKNADVSKTQEVYRIYVTVAPHPRFVSSPERPILDRVKDFPWRPAVASKYVHYAVYALFGDFVVPVVQ